MRMVNISLAYLQAFAAALGSVAIPFQRETTLLTMLEVLEVLVALDLSRSLRLIESNF